MAVRRLSCVKLCAAADMIKLTIEYIYICITRCCVLPAIAIMRSWLLQIDEDKEARKLEAARAVLAGRSFTEGEEDPFEGLGPQEIQAYIDKALDGVSHSDPFEVRPSAVAGYAMTISMLFPSNVSRAWANHYKLP